MRDMRGLPVPGRKVRDSVGRGGKEWENEWNMLKRCQTLRIFDGRKQKKSWLNMVGLVGNCGDVLIFQPMASEFGHSM